MIQDQITAELRAIEHDLLDMREALDDAPDIGTATRIRVAIRARQRRQVELELARSEVLGVEV